MYHAVDRCPPGGVPALYVSAARFARQVGFLARAGYRSATVQNCIDQVNGSRTPRRLVAFTFDDAYASLCQAALPLLMRHGFTAIVFVPSALVGKTNEWDERHNYPSHAIMSADQIRTWSARGFEFGSHTRTHVDLAETPARELDDELTGSRVELEAVLDKPVRSFAYPYGSCSEAARAIVGARYEIGFSTREGLNHGGADRASLNRTMVHQHDGILNLAVSLRNGVNFRAGIRRRVRENVEAITRGATAPKA